MAGSSDTLGPELCSGCKLGEATRKLSCMPISEDIASSIRVERGGNSAMKMFRVAPPFGYLKLNVAAKNFAGSCPSTGVAAEIEDRSGCKICSMAFKLSGNFSDTMLKAVAMREGLRWALTLHFPVRSFVVETDCLMLLDRLVSQTEDWFEYSMAVMACRVLLRQFDKVVVKQIRKEANLDCRKLADSAEQLTCFQQQFEDYTEYCDRTVYSPSWLSN